MLENLPFEPREGLFAKSKEDLRVSTVFTYLKDTLDAENEMIKDIMSDGDPLKESKGSENYSQQTDQVIMKREGSHTWANEDTSSIVYV